MGAAVAVLWNSAWSLGFMTGLVAGMVVTRIGGGGPRGGD
jgi:hypothetical protein